MTAEKNENLSVVDSKVTAIRLFSELFNFKFLFFIGFGAVLLGTLATLLEPRVIGYCIDHVFNTHNYKILNQIVFVFLLLHLTRVLCLFMQGYWFEKLGQKVMYSLRMRMLTKIHSLPASHFDKHPSGRLVTRVTNDVASISDMFSAGFVTMFGNILVVVGIWIAMAIMSLKLTLWVGLVLPFIIIATVYFSNKLHLAYRETRSRLSSLNSFLAENILGFRVVQLFNRQKNQLARFERINDWYSNAQQSTLGVFSIFQPTITLLAGAGMVFGLGLGGEWVQSGELKLGDWVAYCGYIVSLFQPLREIAEKWNVFLSGLASSERVFEILDWKTEMELEVKEVAPFSSNNWDIEFKDVWFSYLPDRWVLKGLNLKVFEGQSVGIIGHTGAGKSTLLQVLLRFYEIQKGQILIGGRDIKTIDLRELRAAFGWIQQDPFLFSGSLEDNAYFWKSKISSIQSWTDFYADLGFKEQDLARLKKIQLDERAGNLSSGEKQVLAFYRAYSKDPKVWVLDEATSNIDSLLEDKLQAKLIHETKQRTCLVIAHRLATVKNLDQLIVLHQGKIIESGSHSELLNKKGVYFNFYSFQQKINLAH